MDWNKHSCLTFKMADKRLQWLLCNTVTFETRLMYEGGIWRIERRHFAWNPSIFRSSALFNHIVRRQYNNFDTTQAWKIRIFWWGCKVECRQTLASLSNWPLASPNRLQISGVKIFETVSHSNIPVDQKRSVCKKRFRRSLKMMCQIWGVIASTCCAKHASQPFMCRATVKDFNYLSISKRHFARTLWLSCKYFCFPHVQV